MYQRLGIGKMRALRDFQTALQSRCIHAKLEAMDRVSERSFGSRETYPLAEIATDCEFIGYNYFITVFSREVGITPEKYRRSCFEKSDS